MSITYNLIWCVVCFPLYLCRNNKTDMIMKLEKIYSWVLRISNPTTGEVEYRTRTCLTTAEIQQEAETLISINGDLYVSIFKLYKIF